MTLYFLTGSLFAFYWIVLIHTLELTPKLKRAGYLCTLVVVLAWPFIGFAAFLALLRALMGRRG